MIRTEPGGDPIDPLETQLALRRGHTDKPWVMANFISTIDGAAVVDGGSTAINDADDKAMFGAIRAIPDFIVVGAGTVRAEDYRPVTLNETRRAARTELGLEPTPHLVVVSASLSLDPGARVFSDAKHRVTVLTNKDAPDDRVSELSEVADVVRLRDTRATDILHYLRMARVILCEGGPSLMGQFIAADLVDEMALTIAPVLVAGDAPRVARSQSSSARPQMRLDGVLYGDRVLFLRYVRSFETS